MTSTYAGLVTHTDSPVTATLVWARPGPAGIYHLAYAGSIYTLCGASREGDHWVEVVADELPADARRFPCSHCAGARRRWFRW